MKLKASIVDVETTGLDNRNDDVVELGIVQFEYDHLTGQVLGTVEEYAGLRDPGRPVPEGAARAHGLTWDVLRGHSLDDARVKRLLAGSMFLIAHNAKFDRGFLERLYPETKRMKWLCSMDGVDWRGKGFPSKGLQKLLERHGLVAEAAHRALDDAKNTLRLLGQTGANGKSYLSELTGTLK